MAKIKTITFNVDEDQYIEAKKILFGLGITCNEFAQEMFYYLSLGDPNIKEILKKSQQRIIDGQIFSSNNIDIKNNKNFNKELLYDIIEGKLDVKSD